MLYYVIVYAAFSGPVASQLGYISAFLQQKAAYSLSLSISFSLYIYTYTYTYVCVYIYIYTHINTCYAIL